MHAVSATEFARNFRRMLDQVEHHGMTISIARHRKQIAIVVPQRPHQGAMEAFGDLYRPLAGAVEDDWLADIERVDQALACRFGGAEQDPWR